MKSYTDKELFEKRHKSCKICSGFTFYKDNSGIWHECPRCVKLPWEPKPYVMPRTYDYYLGIGSALTVRWID